YDQQGAYNVIWEYTDLNGNTFNQNQTVMVTSSLPVELSTFELNCLREGIELRWTTVSETNNDFFEIQYSNDARNWQTVGRITGAGNTLEEQHYRFVDKRFGLSSNLYRLRQQDFDETESYSDIKTIECLGGQPSNIAVFPNPVVDHITVALTDLTDQSTQIWITTHTGQIVEEKFVTPSSPFSEQHFSLGGLPPGVYNIHVKTNGQPFVSRVVKIGL
ncbi:MAG: T9SS type A sorting domain-containing protein, partial [Bacteroidota bacterium]